MTIRRLLKRIPGARSAAIRFNLLSNHTARREFLFEFLPPASVGAEIGVDRGDFSERILSRVKPKTLHLIDPWKYFDSEAYATSCYGGERGGSQAEMDERYLKIMQRFKAQIASQQVVVHRSFSHEVSPNFSDAYFDWVYIDGDHHYESVKRDLETYYSKVKQGGCLLGDDYGGKGWKGGVTQAVDEFVATDRVTLVGIRDRQFILRKV